jgi:hypothetical protein
MFEQASDTQHDCLRYGLHSGSSSNSFFSCRIAANVPASGLPVDCFKAWLQVLLLQAGVLHHIAMAPVLLKLRCCEWASCVWSAPSIQDAGH